MNQNRSASVERFPMSIPDTVYDAGQRLRYGDTLCRCGRTKINRKTVCFAAGGFLFAVMVGFLRLGFEQKQERGRRRERTAETGAEYRAERRSAGQLRHKTADAVRRQGL